MYIIQRDLLYFPTHRGLTPESVGLSAVEIVKLGAGDGQAIEGWYAPPPPGGGLILYFQGNGGEIGDRADRFAFYQSQGFGMFFLSYRGYGNSGGSPTEAGLVADAQSAYAWLSGEGIRPENLFLVGESLGTGIAVQLAAKNKVAAIALEAPYSSTADIAAELYWWLPVRILMKDQFDSMKFIADIGVPLLIAHGEADTLIPIAYGRRLFDAAGEPKIFIAKPGIGHDLLFRPDTWETEVAFFRGLKAP